MMKKQQVFRTLLLGFSIWTFLVAAVSAVGFSSNTWVQFSATNSSGSIPLAVAFQNNTILQAVGLTYRWDFGDGAVSSEENPVHTYTSVGMFDVTLTITSAAGGSFSGTRRGFVQTQNLIMLADFEDENTYADLWDDVRGPLHWTDSPALLGVGGLAVAIEFANGLWFPERMQGDDGMVVAGGGSGSGCPIPTIPCFVFNQDEPYGIFSFRFSLAEVEAEDGAWFRIFQLFEGDESGASLVEVLVHKASGNFYLEYVVDQNGQALAATTGTISANTTYELELSWMAGRAMQSASGQFHAELQVVGTGILSNNAGQMVSVFNIDNHDQGFDIWRLGMFDSFFPLHGGGRLFLDQFTVRRTVPAQFQNDLINP